MTKFFSDFIFSKIKGKSLVAKVGSGGEGFCRLELDKKGEGMQRARECSRISR